MNQTNKSALNSINSLARMSNLFKPLRINDSIEIGHRVALAPLTRMRAHNNQVTNLHTEYYSQRASRPGTFMITEATFISEAAGGYASAPGIFKQSHIDGWGKVFKAIHKNKSFIFMQLWALGRCSPKYELDKLGHPYVSASNLPEPVNNPDQPIPHALTIPEIKEYVATYVQAAKNAIEAGADGVEIHSANAYLLDQFLHSNSNIRTDEYGGSIENRARFVLEVVDAVSAAIGADRVGIRLSPWGELAGVHPGVTPIPQWSYVIGELQTRAEDGRGLAYIHVIEPRWAGKATAVRWELQGASKGSNQFVLDIWDGPVIRAGGYDLPLALEHANANDRTIIAMGRHFIANPDLVTRWEKEAELNKYHRETFYAPDEKGYIDYPFLAESQVTLG